jgi:hypothetical protein
MRASTLVMAYSLFFPSCAVGYLQKEAASFVVGDRVDRATCRMANHSTSGLSADKKAEPAGAAAAI